MSESLSIEASVAGIITATVRTATILNNLHDAPDHIADLSAETSHVQLVLRTLQRLIEKLQDLPSQRAAMVQLEDVVVVLTETVLVFSQLEATITSLAARQRSSTQKLTWVWERSTTVRLINQLQRHRASLTLLLQIITWSVMPAHQSDDTDDTQQL
jgi:hypothetical protein